MPLFAATDAPPASTPRSDARWPSPRAEDSESIGHHPGQEDSLGASARFWRTPDAPSGGGVRNRQDSRGHGHQTTIAEQAEHWPTPNVPNGGRGVPLGATVSGRTMLAADGRKAQVQLHHVAEQWPTPTASSQNTMSVEPDLRDRPDGVALQTAAVLWPTPAARDHKGSPTELTRPDGRSRLDQLDRVSEYWPTPCARNDNKSPEAHLEMKARMPGGARRTITSLQVLTQLWPTPTAQDSIGSRRATARTEAWGSNDGTTLTDAIWMFFGWRSTPPAPASATYGSPSSPPDPTSPPPSWSTPMADDARAAGGEASRDRHQMPLHTQARSFAEDETWSTPRAHCNIQNPKNLPPPSEGGRSSKPGLEDQARTLTPTTARARLNPRFVEWLMGLPIGWSDAVAPLEPTAFAVWAMASRRWLRHLRSATSSPRPSPRP